MNRAVRAANSGGRLPTSADSGNCRWKYSLLHNTKELAAQEGAWSTRPGKQKWNSRRRVQRVVAHKGGSKSRVREGRQKLPAGPGKILDQGGAYQGTSRGS